MITSYSIARNEIFGQLNIVKPALATLLGYAPKIIYQGVESSDKMPTDGLWIRASMVTVDESQATLRDDNGRRYNTDGIFFAQIFIPKVPVEMYDKGVKTAEIIKNAYRGKQTESCIWFNRVRIQDNIPSESAWFRLNVVAEYQYDEIG